MQNVVPEVTGPFDVIAKGVRGELIQIATNAISSLGNGVQAEPFGVSWSSKKWACLPGVQLSGAQKRPFAETTRNFF
jgi:hypothetical protein